MAKPTTQPDAFAQSFSAALIGRPKVLILGSIPGQVSLKQQQYYAHPRNAFWPIVCDYFELAVEQPYEARLQGVLEKGVALWDVLQQCERPGSLDGSIVNGTQVPNPIDKLLEATPSIKAVLLNGGTAAKHFKRAFPNAAQKVCNLPSTSPANAAMPLAEKKRRWHAALDSVFKG